jgi:hypothetical protein
VLGAAVQCFDDGRRRAESHVGHPHRDDVSAPGIFPLLVGGAAPINHLVEIETPSNRKLDVVTVSSFFVRRSL